MQAYLMLVRRELGAYFASWTGYVILATLLFLLGLSFCDVLAKLNVEATEAPITEQFFVTVYFWLILLLTTPVITMRTFSVEKFSGTYETLMTCPIRDIEVVLAKFSGAFVFYLIAWLPLFIHLLTVREFSNDPSVLTAWSLLTTYLGLVLIGSVFISLGCFASALTRSQVLAAMVAYALGTGLFLLSLRSLRSTPLEGWSAELFDFISMTEHMEEFARGVFDTRYVILYFSLTVFFLFLTTKVVESRRWR